MFCGPPLPSDVGLQVARSSPARDLLSGPLGGVGDALRGSVSRISALSWPPPASSSAGVWCHGGRTRVPGHDGCVVTAALFPALPVGGSFSWIAPRSAAGPTGGKSPPERAPIWGPYLIRLQLSAIYCFAAFDKIDPEWLDGERLARLVLNFYGYAELLRDQPWIHAGCVALAWFTTLTEFSLGACLAQTLRRSSRPSASSFTWILRPPRPLAAQPEDGVALPRSLIPTTSTASRTTSCDHTTRTRSSGSAERG